MNPNDPDQLGWRETLRKAKQAYESARYEGDLADDVFARLDAAKNETPIPIASDPRMSIDQPARSSRRLDWRPLLAIAATLAVIATTWFTLRQAGPKKQVPSDIAIETPATIERTTTTRVAVAAGDPVPEEATVASNTATTEDDTMFSVVPSYQAMSFSLPDSLTLASLDEYSQQSQTETTASQTTSTETGTR